MTTEKKKNWKNYIDTSLMLTAIVFVGTFYLDWKTDEANEDAEAKVNETRMFDTPNDKLETKSLVETVKPAAVEVKWAKDEMVQQQILDKLIDIEKKQKTTDSIARLGVRLIYEVEQSH